MGEFQRKTAGFTHRGIQWNRPADKVPDEQILYGRNIRVPQQTTITQRPGNTTFSNLGGTFTHSIARLNNYNTTLVNFDFTYVIGQDASLFVGKTNAILTNTRSGEHTSELQSHVNLVCRLLLEKKKNIQNTSLLN